MTNITLSDAVRSFTRIAQNNPAHFSQVCEYTCYNFSGTTEPMCIVGKYLIDDLGVSPDWLSSQAGEFGGQLVDHLKGLGIYFDRSAIEFISTVQAIQDARWADVDVPGYSSDVRQLIRHSNGYTADGGNRPTWAVAVAVARLLHRV